MPAPTREVSYKRDIVSAIRKYAFTYGYSLGDIARAAGISLATLYSRLKSPGTFTLDELNRIAKFLKIPVKELAPFLTWGYAN